MRYRTAFPYFDDDDIENILIEFKKILQGDGMLTMGSNVDFLEKSFSSMVGARYSIATNSCTSALETVLTAIGVSSEDEVIVPAQTFIATGSSVARSGGIPIFAEINKNFLMDKEDLYSKLNHKTKAVILVHFAGLIDQDIFEIRDHLKQKGIFLIEDAAHAPGASINDIKAGNIGDFGCFSFFSTKNITTGEGGMITTNNEKLANLCGSIRNRGLDLGSDKELFKFLGSNFRMTEIQAILGRYQLRKLDSFNKHRNSIAEIYKSKLQILGEEALIEIPKIPDNIFHTYWRFWIKLRDFKKRDELKNQLKEVGIDIDWAYTPLLHLQPVFKDLYGTRLGMLPKSEEMAETHICLPIHMKISEEGAIFISDMLIEKLRQLS